MLIKRVVFVLNYSFEKVASTYKEFVIKCISKGVGLIETFHSVYKRGWSLISEVKVLKSFFFVNNF